MNIIGECGKIFLLKDGEVYVYKKGSFVLVPIVDDPPITTNIVTGDDPKDQD